MALTQADLDLIGVEGCQNPDCTDPHCGDKVFLHARCHVGVPTWAIYHKKLRVIQILCGACRKLIVEVAVAKGPT